MDELEKLVIAFVADFTGRRIEKISLDSRLCHDLGVDGDDGVELLENFSERFQVEINPPEGHQYFGPEAAVNPLSLLRWLLSPAFRRRDALTPHSH